MIAANLICAFLIASIPFVLPLGSSWLYLLVALSSAAGQFFAPAQASVLPETAPDQELAAANAMMTISQYGALTIGYAGAGLIATLASIAWAFYLDALSFVLSALCILLVRVVPLAAKEGSNLAAVAQNLRAGLVFVRDTPVLRSLVLVFVPTFIIYGFVNSLSLAFATRSLGATEFEYGLMEGGFTVGFVVGSLVMARLADRLHAGRWVAVSLLGMGLFMVCQALAWSVLAAVTFSTLIGILNAPSYLGRQLLIQRTTPREVRGRVSSVFFVTRDTGFMLGMLAAGLADLFDVRQLLAVNALLLIGCGLLALILPGLGQPIAEWRHVLAMLRAAPAAPGLGRAALVADIDRLAIHLPALAHVSRQERQALAAQTRVYDAPPGTAIVRQGEQSDAAYFLLDGRTVASRARMAPSECWGSSTYVGDELLDRSLLRHRRLGAHHGRRERASSVGIADRRIQGVSPRELHRQRAAEGVARCGRIDRSHGVAGHSDALFGLGEQRTARPQRQHRRANAARQQRPGGAPGRLIVGDAQAGQNLRLSFVRRQHVDQPQQFVGQRPGRGRVEQYAHACGVGDFGRALDGVERHFELENERIGAGDRIGGTLDILRADAPVRARYDDDAVVAFRIDDDRRDAGAAGAILRDVPRVDTFGMQRLPQPPAEIILPEPANHAHGSALPRRRYRLVQPLSADEQRERFADQGFAALRLARGSSDQIHVEATDDDDSGGPADHAGLRLEGHPSNIRPLCAGFCGSAVHATTEPRNRRTGQCRRSIQIWYGTQN
jgi:MFS family permease